jgi:N-acetylneuraminate synthase
MNYKKPIIIAEIGCNHKGDFEIALELIKTAKECGADVAKFQKRTNKELLSEEQYSTPHPNSYNSYGNTYGEHREFLEFSLDQHKKLKEYCESIDIEYSTSVWDVTSAREISSINPKFIKIPSASNTNYEMMKVLRDEYKGEVHISVGMTTINEEIEFIKFFAVTNQANRLVVYSCTSGYPVPFEDVCLLEINRLKDSYESEVKSIGFSGHHLGIAIDVAAYTLGAHWIERHFTLDRTWKGTDHSASLEPEGLKKMIRNLHATYKALTHKNEEILDIEKVQREKLKVR